MRYFKRYEWRKLLHFQNYCSVYSPCLYGNFIALECDMCRGLSTFTLSYSHLLFVQFATQGLHTFQFVLSKRSVITWTNSTNISGSVSKHQWLYRQRAERRVAASPACDFIIAAAFYLKVEFLSKFNICQHTLCILCCNQRGIYTLFHLSSCLSLLMSRVLESKIYLSFKPINLLLLKYFTIVSYFIIVSEIVESIFIPNWYTCGFYQIC